MNCATLQQLSPPPAPSRAVRGMAVPLPSTYNYIGAFLTFRCPYACAYCINRFGDSDKYSGSEIPGSEWVSFFNRLESSAVPITLQGGEPGLHPDFVDIVDQLTRTRPVDILTNLAFDLDQFICRIPPSRLNREAPYAPIRVSFHPSQFTLFEIVRRVQRLEKAGFRVGLYGVLHPAQLETMQQAADVCSRIGMDFRTKPFLGWHEGRLYGEYAYPDACMGADTRVRECAPSELLVAPDGAIHRCHADLYGGRSPCAQVGERHISLSGDFQRCDRYGHCNPCDVKVKNDRFQQFGHVAVQIRVPSGGV